LKGNEIYIESKEKKAFNVLYTKYK